VEAALDIPEMAETKAAVMRKISPKITPETLE
jgi:hypothetical protein